MTEAMKGHPMPDGNFDMVGEIRAKQDGKPTIDDDIMETAKAVWAESRLNTNPMPLIIAAALQAERQRCADVVQAKITSIEDQTDGNEIGIIDFNMCCALAETQDAILTPEGSDKP